MFNYSNDNDMKKYFAIDVILSLGVVVSLFLFVYQLAVFLIQKP